MKILVFYGMLLLLSTIIICGNKKKHINDPANTSRSFMKTTSFSYSNINGKEDKHFKDMELEENRDLQSDGKERVRKFGQMLNKNNNDPANLTRRASSNVETEQLELGNPEKKQLKPEEEDVSIFITNNRKFWEKT